MYLPIIAALPRIHDDKRCMYSYMHVGAHWELFSVRIGCLCGLAGKGRCQPAIMDKGYLIPVQTSAPACLIVECLLNSA